jgi:integrase
VARAARTIFLVLVTIGLRRGEVQGLRWRDVEIADPDGPRLRVRETWVRDGADTPKSEAGERTIPLGPRITDEPYEHLARTSYSGADERVFVSPQKGTPFDTARDAETFRLALAKADVGGTSGRSTTFGTPRSPTTQPPATRPSHS